MWREKEREGRERSSCYHAESGESEVEAVNNGTMEDVGERTGRRASYPHAFKSGQGPERPESPEGSEGFDGSKV